MKVTIAAVSVLLVAILVSPGLAAPGTPTYSWTWNDAVTGDNQYTHNGKHYWNVDAGADVYQQDVYERPTVQTYQMIGGKYAASEYFGYLDITKASLGWDSKYLYTSIDLFSLNKVTNNGVSTQVGLVERYGFRLGLNPDGRYSTLFYADQPQLKNTPNTSWGTVGTFAFRDTDGDVGGRGVINGNTPSGLTVTKSDNPKEEVGMNGYNLDLIADGKLKTTGASVFYTRINPLDATIVEFALDYGALGYTAANLMNLTYVEFEAIKGGPKDPKNYLWNDKYTKLEAGSPNPGTGGLSEFGTQGLGNIYELDTLRGSPLVPDVVVPEMSSLVSSLIGLPVVVGYALRRRHLR